MQVNPLQSLLNTGNTVPVSRQQTGLAQRANSDEAAPAVLPSLPQAVAAVGQNQAQEQSKDSAQRQKSDPRELQSSVKQLNDIAKLYNSELEFSVDKDTNIQVVKVVDKESQKMIRQIPSEDAIRLAKAIGDFKGLLIKDQA